jgi:hypothetical protein
VGWTSESITIHVSLSSHNSEQDKIDRKIWKQLRKKINKELNKKKYKSISPMS